MVKSQVSDAKIKRVTQGTVQGYIASAGKQPGEAEVRGSVLRERHGKDGDWHAEPRGQTGRVDERSQGRREKREKKRESYIGICAGTGLDLQGAARV